MRVHAFNTCATPCARKAVEIARLEILAIAHLHRIAEPSGKRPRNGSSAATNSLRARSARPEFEQQDRDAGCVPQQRLQKQRGKRVRVQVRFVARSRARAIAGVLGKNLAVTSSGTFSANCSRGRRGPEQPLPEFRRRELIEGKIAADDRKCFGVFRQALRLKLLLRETAARGVRSRVRSGPSQPSYFQELVPIQIALPARQRRAAAQARARPVEAAIGAADRTAAAARHQRRRIRHDLIRVRRAVVERVRAGFDHAAGQELDHHRRRAVVVARHDVDLVARAAATPAPRTAECAHPASDRR